jgi:hypothetical protein
MRREHLGSIGIAQVLLLCDIPLLYSTYFALECIYANLEVETFGFYIALLYNLTFVSSSISSTVGPY